MTAIVVDTSVARQCGNVTTANALSVRCRDLLRAIETNELRVVISDDIRREWKKHASRYARLWLTDMVSRNRHLAVDPSRHAGIRSALSTLNADDRAAVEKDLLLIEAAVDGGSRVISRDWAMRKILHSLAQDVQDLGSIHWTGPEHDGCLAWLNSGAPDDSSLKLAQRLVP